jgi:LacI family transcriptional regulator
MITIKDIAKLAGVSIGTVDRVLHNRGRVAKETEKNIKEIIKKYNYQPNIFASQLKKGEKYNFCVIMPMPSQDGGYWNIPLKGIKKAQAELIGRNVTIEIHFYDKYDITIFESTFKKIIKNKFDGFLIAPVLFEAVSKIINEIPENIPYVFFDSYLPGGKQIAFIGQNAYASGFVAAKLMKCLINGLSKIVVFDPIPEDYHIEERVKGFTDYCKKNNKNAIVCTIEGSSSKLNVSQRINKLIDKNGIDGIFFPSALTYLAAQCIEKFDKKIYLIGYDLLEENKKYLNKDIIDFIIDQEPYKQGYEGIYLLYKHICLKERIKKTIYLPINIIMKENLEFIYSL